MIRSRVDFPDPDGPRNAMNSRASTESDRSSRTGVAPKAFRTLRICRLKSIPSTRTLQDAPDAATAGAQAFWWAEHRWRRRRDSNPRYGLTPYGGLANRWFQPLTHVSS